MVIEQTHAEDRKAPRPCPVCGKMPVVQSTRFRTARAFYVWCPSQYDCENYSFARADSIDEALAKWNRGELTVPTDPRP
jgi:Restriction alleviation protein Lar